LFTLKLVLTALLSDATFWDIANLNEISTSQNRTSEAEAFFGVRWQAMMGG